MPQEDKMKLTAKDLIATGACSKQVALFRKHFPRGGVVTLAKVMEVAEVFDWDWAAKHLLTPAATAEYDRASAAAWDEYKRARAPALAEYQRATAPAEAEYQRAIAPAYTEYHRVRAEAWFEGWRKDHATGGQNETHS